MVKDIKAIQLFVVFVFDFFLVGRAFLNKSCQTQMFPAA
jgi:hypothetical protein